MTAEQTVTDLEVKVTKFTSTAAELIARPEKPAVKISKYMKTQLDEKKVELKVIRMTT